MSRAGEFEFDIGEPCPEWIDPEFLTRLRATHPHDMATFDIEWDREDQRWSR